MAEQFEMRSKCKHCGEGFGRIETRNGQDCVFCAGCNRHQYNAPRTETGKAQRTVTTIHSGIKPKQRARIITRATGRCEMCGSRGNIHVGHIISVAVGMEMGLTDSQLNDDENLAALCEECNLGISGEPMPLRLAMGMLLARIQHRKSTAEPAPF